MRDQRSPRRSSHTGAPILRPRRRRRIVRIVDVATAVPVEGNVRGRTRRRTCHARLPGRRCKKGTDPARARVARTLVPDLFRNVVSRGIHYRRGRRVEFRSTHGERPGARRGIVDDLAVMFIAAGHDKRHVGMLRTYRLKGGVPTKAGGIALRRTETQRNYGDAGNIRRGGKRRHDLGIGVSLDQDRYLRRAPARGPTRRPSPFR